MSSIGDDVVSVTGGASSSKICQECSASLYPTHKAASLGHLACMRMILADLKDARVLLDKEDQTPLHVAAAAGKVDCLKYLLQHTRIPSRVKNKKGETCAHLASKWGQLECLKVLLGGTLKRAQTLGFQRDNKGNSVLHMAVLSNDNDISLWLLRRFGKDVANLPNHDNVLPLHIAAAQGNIEFIRIATNYDFQMANWRDRNGATPAFYSVQGGHLQSLKYLIEKDRADLRAVTHRGQSLLHAAALSGRVETLQWLLARMHPNSIYQLTLDEATVFHYAAFGGHEAMLRLLFKSSNGNKKFLVTTIDCRGNSLLHLCALNNRLSCAKFLLELGADPTMPNKAGHSAMDIANKRGHEDLVSLLLAALPSGKKRLWKDFLKNSASTVRKPMSMGTSGYGSGGSGPSSPPSEINEISPAPVHQDQSSGYGPSTDSVFTPGIQTDTANHHSSSGDSQDSLLRNRDNWLLLPDARLAKSEFYDNAPTIITEASVPSSRNMPQLSVAIISRRRKSVSSLVGERKREDPAPDLPVIRSRSFLDLAVQTEPDPLDENVMIQDDSGRIIWAVGSKTKKGSAAKIGEIKQIQEAPPVQTTGDRELKYAGIAAAEQIDRVLQEHDGSASHYTTVTTAVVHAQPLEEPNKSDPDPVLENVAVQEKVNQTEQKVPEHQQSVDEANSELSTHVSQSTLTEQPVNYSLQHASRIYDFKNPTRPNDVGPALTVPVLYDPEPHEEQAENSPTGMSKQLRRFSSTDTNKSVSLFDMSSLASSKQSRFSTTGQTPHYYQSLQSFPEDDERSSTFTALQGISPGGFTDSVISTPISAADSRSDLDGHHFRSLQDISEGSGSITPVAIGIPRPLGHRHASSSKLSSPRYASKEPITEQNPAFRDSISEVPNYFRSLQTLPGFQISTPVTSGQRHLQRFHTQPVGRMGFPDATIDRMPSPVLDKSHSPSVKDVVRQFEDQGMLIMKSPESGENPVLAAGNRAKSPHVQYRYFGTNTTSDGEIQSRIQQLIDNRMTSISMRELHSGVPPSRPGWRNIPVKAENYRDTQSPSSMTEVYFV